MPYLLETSDGQYLCDVGLSKNGPQAVETSHSFAHVSRTLRAALSLRAVVADRGVQCAVVGVPREPIALSDSERWPDEWFNQVAGEFDSVLRRRS